MSLLYRYIFSQFSRNLALVISGLITIYLLVDFFEKIDNFAEAGKSTGLAIRYLFLKIPLIIDQLLPVCLLLAGVITLGVMNQNREIMALESAGMSIREIYAPILLAACFFTLLGLFSGEWIVPDTIRETNRIWYEEVRKTQAQGIVRHGRVFYKGKDGIYSFKRSPKSKELFIDFHYLTWDADFTMTSQITAKRAVWQDNLWQLDNGRIKTISENGRYAIIDFKSRKISLPDQPGEFFVPEYKGEEKSISDHLKEALRNGDPDLAAWQELQRRLSYLFLGIPLVLLGLPVLLIANRRWRQDLSLAVPMSCVMAFLAWGWWSTAQSMVNAYGFSPAGASWSIHLLTGGLGLLMINRQSNKPI
ncbi:MAG: LptF/LptG family permease [Desulfurivibrionaceae bacterium]|nr:LptF/LptG family permease [Desulfobulbales bacterium]MDT8334409.1 LptF/LptG family permease [Desulfurivibrionaceae bacterium]